MKGSLKIGVNARFLTKPFTGIGQHTRYLYEALAKQNPETEFLLVTPASANVAFTANVKIAVVPEKFPGTSGMKKTYWEQVQVPKFLLDAKVDLAHFPYPSNPWRGFSRPAVVTVHDTIPWTMPSYRRSVSTRLYQDRCRKAVKKADHVLTVSEVSRNEIVQVCHVPAEKISVTYNAPAPHFFEKVPPDARRKILQKYGIDPDRKFLLYYGGYDERKNVKTIVDVFMEAIAQDFEVDLVLAGGKSLDGRLYDSFDSLTRARNSSSFGTHFVREGKIVLTGFVDEQDLPALCQSCFAFLNLSRKEGFNLPLLEAAVSGAPLLASDLAVHHEVAGDLPLYCPPDDRRAFENLLKKLLTDAEYYQLQKQKIENYRCPYSWEKTATEVMNIFKKMA